MIRPFEILKDKIQGKATVGQRRSPEWRKVRGIWLLDNPVCEVCGGKHPEVHHIVPFNIAPHLELEPKNFKSLCERKKYGINCHLLIGHLGNYRRANPNCEIDVVTWRMKLKE